MNAGFTSWLASSLIAAARRLLPPERRDWADAMRAEITYLPDRTALKWALGCLVAAIKQKFIPMNTGTLRISRWVMLLEALGCFVPATLAWFWFTLGPAGILRLSGANIEKNFLAEPGGTFFIAMWWASAVIGLFAPVGLYLGLRYVLVGRPLRNRAFGSTLIAAPLLQTAVGIVAYLAFAPLVPPPNLALILLCVVAPVGGIVHLMYLGRHAPDPLLTGASAAAN